MVRVSRAVENRIVAMLTENTGVSGLDSGMHYGRHWQRNQGKTLATFRAQPSAYWDGYCHTVDVFHFLRKRLSLDATCNAFNRACVPAEDWYADMSHGLSAKGQKWLERKKFRIAEDVFGGGFNTYNHENPLSQTLQGTFITTEEDHCDIYKECYVLLQIHGGCDARGGYTDARLFTCSPVALFTWDVYGTVTRPNGDTVEVSSIYNGHSLTTDNGDSVEIGEDDKVSLWCAEC